MDVCTNKAMIMLIIDNLLDVFSDYFTSYSSVFVIQVGDTESVVSERCTCPSLDVDTYYHMGLR